MYEACITILEQLFRYFAILMPCIIKKLLNKLYSNEAVDPKLTKNKLRIRKIIPRQQSIPSCLLKQISLKEKKNLPE